jgi:hypothetical protein
MQKELSLHDYLAYIIYSFRSLLAQVDLQVCELSFSLDESLDRHQQYSYRYLAM